MRKIRLTLIFCCILTSCEYWNHYNHDYSQSDEDLLKNKIGHFGDYSLNNDDVQLLHFSNYYIGYAKYQPDSYYIGYLIKDRQVKICRVFNRKWDKNEIVNSDIIKANDSLAKINLHIDTIYGEQDNGNIGIAIVDDRGNEVSNWDIADISAIKNFEKYILVKCFSKNCPQLSLEFIK